MPCIDLPLESLKTYTGTNPKPAGFDDYWIRALKELDGVDPQPVLKKSEAIHPKNAEVFDLWFTGVGGARIYAKYICPSDLAKPCPAVLEFHGYTGNSGAWSDKLALVSEGIAVAAMDCRGQGGKSEDAGGVTGNTHHGHIIRGLNDGAEKLLFRSIFLDTVQLARVVMGFQEINAARVSTNGGSQGGALSIACAALEPRIARCVSVYPFLSDYQRVWNMDLAKDAYAELKTYFRLFDPTHAHEKEFFEILGHIDVHHLAPRIKAETIMAITLMDAICPPSTQFAVYNAIQSKKSHIIYPDHAHEGLPGWSDAVFDFLTWNR